MSDTFSPDFMFSRITNVNFGGAWAAINIQVGGTDGTDWRAEIDFPGLAGGTPGIFCFTQAVTNSGFKPAQVDPDTLLPMYTIQKGDLTSSLRTSAGKIIPAFGVAGYPFFAVLFVQINNATKNMRLNFTDSGGVGAFVNATTYSEIRIGTKFTTIDPGTQGPSIGTNTKKVDRKFTQNPAPSGHIDIDIDPKKLSIILS